MPAAPREPEKYSIDDMMERLRTQSEGKPEDAQGELVTRADGSQAIRVKRRKRRSSQPKKEQEERTRRSRIIQAVAVLVFLFLVALGGGGMIIYANSSSYKSGLLDKITVSTGAKVGLREFRVSPASANASALVLTWPAGNVLKKLEARRLQAMVHPQNFFGKSWTGEEVTASEALLLLGSPDAEEARVLEEIPDREAPVHFTRLWVQKTHMVFGDPASPRLAIRDTESSLYPKNVSGRVEMRLKGGALKIPGWSDMKVDRALIEFRGDETELIALRVLDAGGSRGSCELAGTVYPYESDRRSRLTVALDSYPLEGLAGPGWSQLISGRVDSVPSSSSNFLELSSSGVRPEVMDVSFAASLSSRTELSGFPFLYALSRGLRDQWFERPFFEAGAVGSLYREGGRTELRNLVLESRGRMIVSGGLQLQPDGSLSGTLKVGVAETILKAADSVRLASVFPESKDGFRWATLTVGGTAERPTDNFAELYEGGAAPSPGGTSGAPSFEDLTRPR